MKEKNKASFEDIYEQNKRRIHYQLHKLNINDSNGDFFQEGLVAMWNAYERYQPDKGPMSTYFNFIIRNRIIDLIRKQKRDKVHEDDAVAEHFTKISSGNHHQKNGMQRPIHNVSELPIDDPQLWKNVKANLTENQWKWIYYYIIADMAVKDIAIQENTSVEAVKSWGKQAKKKLREPAFRLLIQWEVE